MKRFVFYQKTRLLFAKIKNLKYSIEINVIPEKKETKFKDRLVKKMYNFSHFNINDMKSEKCMKNERDYLFSKNKNASNNLRNDSLNSSKTSIINNYEKDQDKTEDKIPVFHCFHKKSVAITHDKLNNKVSNPYSERIIIHLYFQVPNLEKFTNQSFKPDFVHCILVSSRYLLCIKLANIILSDYESELGHFIYF